MRISLLVFLLCFVACASTKKPGENKDTNNTNQNKDKVPALTMPKVRKVWVPDKIENDKYIEGHWMWVLERTSTWSQ